MADSKPPVLVKVEPREAPSDDIPCFEKRIQGEMTIKKEQLDSFDSVAIKRELKEDCSFELFPQKQDGLKSKAIKEEFVREDMAFVEESKGNSFEFLPINMKQEFKSEPKDDTFDIVMSQDRSSETANQVSTSCHEDTVQPKTARKSRNKKTLRAKRQKLRRLKKKKRQKRNKGHFERGDEIKPMLSCGGECGMESCDYQTLKANKLKRHKIIPQPTIFWCGGEFCGMLYCDFKTTIKGFLKHHEEIYRIVYEHQDEKLKLTLLCGGEFCGMLNCDFQTTTKGDLNRDSKKKVKDFVSCGFPDCTYKSKYGGNLKRHKIRHGHFELLDALEASSAHLADPKDMDISKNSGGIKH